MIVLPTIKIIPILYMIWQHARTKFHICILFIPTIQICLVKKKQKPTSHSNKLLVCYCYNKTKQTRSFGLSDFFSIQSCCVVFVLYGCMVKRSYHMKILVDFWRYLILFLKDNYHTNNFSLKLLFSLYCFTLFLKYIYIVCLYLFLRNI